MLIVMCDAKSLRLTDLKTIFKKYKINKIRCLKMTNVQSYTARGILINRQAGLKVALALCNMMNSHCRGVTISVSDKQKRPRIKRL